jgi:predicted Zn-dependent protease with MMP-like domain
VGCATSLYIPEPRRPGHSGTLAAATVDTRGAWTHASADTCTGIVHAVDEENPLDPETQRHLDEAWDALEEDDVRAALRALKRAREDAPDDPAVLELEAECALADDRPNDALEAFRRWSEVDPGDAEPWLGSAEVYLENGEPGECARLLRELLADFELDPLDEADARHLLGMACEDKGDRKGMVTEWLAVLRLDAANDPPEPRVDPSRFDQIAEDALEELPPEVLAHLRNVPIFVEDRPSEALVLEGLDPRTLGLFHGIAMPDRSTLSPGPDTGLIHLFQRNLEREIDDEDDSEADLVEQIRITVLHETAHYFGADEDDLQRFGLN